MKKPDWTIKIAAENAFIVYCNVTPLIKSNVLISRLSDALTGEHFPWLISLIPAYQSVLVTYDVVNIDHYGVAKKLRQCVDSLISEPNKPSKDLALKSIIEIPVCYGYSEHNDLSQVASIAGLSEKEVITLHCNPVYQVFCLGFAPGFAYLGEVDSRIATPRRDSPRKIVPKGAVAIAERQTAIYPNQSPGGWNILGLCPLTLFSSKSDTPCRIQTGDKVKFIPIDVEHFLHLQKEDQKTWPI